MPAPISRWIKWLKTSSRLESVMGWYLFSLMVESPKHTLTFASLISGLDLSQFSRFLKNHGTLAKDSLLKISQAIALQLSEGRAILIPGTQWSILLLIDSTLHQRSSVHVRNAQRFNHGSGYIVGHQWTNIVLMINDRIIPLSPIPFFSKNECKRRDIEYKTEHNHIINYLENLNLNLYVGIHNTKEVVVMMDSGYDNKKIFQAIKAREWDFDCALKTNRNVKTEVQVRDGKRKWHRIDNLFRAARKQAPFQTIRGSVNSSKKRMDFRVRRLEGYIKGLTSAVSIVCSEKRKTKGRRYFACSNQSVSTGAIIRGYQKRWSIELFHRAAKNNFGLQDVGVHDFDSVISHVHWVYCAYLLIFEVKLEKGGGLETRQRELKTWIDSRHLKNIIQLCSRFGRKDAIETYCNEALSDLCA
jgi:Transposase DDE domain